MCAMFTQMERDGLVERKGNWNVSKSFLEEVQEVDWAALECGKESHNNIVLSQCLTKIVKVR
jgi:hypothetical protein